MVFRIAPLARRITTPLLLAVPALLWAAGSAHAAQPSYALSDDEAAGRVRLNVTVYGDDPCPTGNDDTIIVCGRKPEAERYRIPKEVRKKEAEENSAPAEQGWGSRAMAADQAGRTMMPNSCSPVGTNGFTGCAQQMFQQWYADRRAAGKLRVIGQD